MVALFIAFGGRVFVCFALHLHSVQSIYTPWLCSIIGLLSWSILRMANTSPDIAPSLHSHTVHLLQICRTRQNSSAVSVTESIAGIENPDSTRSTHSSSS